LKKLDKPLFNRLIQVGIVVKDIKESMEKYIRYGVGPWYVLEFNPGNVDNMMISGKKKEYAMIVAVCPIGDVRFELIQPLTDSIYTDYIDKKGDSIIHHIKLGVDDYDFAEEYLHKAGIKSIQSGHQLGIKGKNIYNYFETSQSLGFILEIANVTNDFIKPNPQYWYPSSGKFKSNSVFKGLLGFTLITSNLNSTIKKYSELFGMDRWETKDFSGRNIAGIESAQLCSEDFSGAGVHKLGDKEIKIIKLKEKKISIFSNFKKKHSIGIIHSLAINFHDFDKAMEMFLANGRQLLKTEDYNGEIRFAYINTSDDLNFITEVINVNSLR
jgi:hypothetical protein